MLFNDHSKLKGMHAFLSASKYHWLGYDNDKLVQSYTRSMAAQRGTELHAFAHEAVRLGIKLPKNGNTISLYVNDAIGYRMETEQVLFYSSNCFGTADAISFRKNKLRIHDLKTGEIPASTRQLDVYIALFCLEYKINPIDIEIESRIYQSNQISIHIPEKDEIQYVKDKIVEFDRIIEDMKMGDMIV